MTQGTRVIIRAPKEHRLGFLNAMQGEVIDRQPLQFDDETAVVVDGCESYYLIDNDLLAPLGSGTGFGEEGGTHFDSSKSYQFFEALLDSADEPHPSSKIFYNELIEAGLLHAQKQRDYGKPTDPFANVRSSEEWGIPGWVGAMVRLNDKVKRLQSLARTGGLANESAIDSFRDIAVYALIALVLYGQEGA